MPNFTQDWFSEVIPLFETILKPLKGKDMQVFIEKVSGEIATALDLKKIRDL